MSSPDLDALLDSALNEEKNRATALDSVFEEIDQHRFEIEKKFPMFFDATPTFALALSLNDSFRRW
jgi:hypothetical protein